MSKKKKQPRATDAEKTIEEESFSPMGVRLMAAGVAAIAVGFFVLSKADPMGRNWASTASPFLILGGYALVGLGVFWWEGADSVSSGPAAPPPQP